MRIAALDFVGVNVTPKTNWCFALLRLEDGRVGIGEITLSDHEALLEAEVAPEWRLPQWKHFFLQKLETF